MNTTKLGVVTPPRNSGNGLTPPQTNLPETRFQHHEEDDLPSARRQRFPRIVAENLRLRFRPGYTEEAI
jgi:hypothetical protein